MAIVLSVQWHFIKFSLFCSSSPLVVMYVWTSWPYSSVVMLFEANVLVCAVLPHFHDLSLLMFAVCLWQQLLGLSGWLTDPFDGSPLHFFSSVQHGVIRRCESFHVWCVIGPTSPLPQLVTFTGRPTIPLILIILLKVIGPKWVTVQ